VPAAELNSEELVSGDEKAATEEGVNGTLVDPKENSSGAFDIIGENGQVIMRNNRLTVDDPSRQTLSLAEIEELKQAGTGSGKEIIAKIMAAHSAIDEKSKFSLAKYTLRKSRKYMKRFTVLPMDVNHLAEFLLEKEAPRVMELRQEALALITSWANVHHVDNQSNTGGRWLVVDDAGGLVVAAMAEKMGILHTPDEETRQQELEELKRQVYKDDTESHTNGESDLNRPELNPKDLHQAASTNAITLIHSNTQPNISVLKYLGFGNDGSFSSHPLYTNLHTLSWLQLLEPESDRAYTTVPEMTTPEESATWKTSRRAAWYRKKRRWKRTRRVVAQTKAGGFDGLVIATVMKPEGVLEHLVPLVKGGGQIVVYSPTVEPLATLVDCYSKERKAAYIARFEELCKVNGGAAALVNDPDFPLDPTLVLHAALQTSRAIEWQVLPMRTHPLMLSKGGAEGYIFTSTRVLPSETAVKAKGRFSKKRKADVSSNDGDVKRIKDNTDTPDKPT
jgi:tRNA (adenine58-N1)-methyltransferase non-catalytic subunit